MSVQCFKKQERIVTEDYSKEYTKYGNKRPIPKVGETFESHIFIPLNLSLEDEAEVERMGVITVQSPKVKAYDNYHVTMLANIANYTAIALRNANAINTIEEQARQLKQSLNKEKELGSLKDQFMYTLSHQYKTPLSTIDIAVQNTVRKIPDVSQEFLRKQMTAIGNNVKRLLRLLEKLLQYGRAFSPGIYNLEQLCREKITDFTTNSDNAHKLIFKSDGQNTDIYADKDLVKILLDNLISNSIKYSPGGSEIKITLERRKNNAVIIVADRGSGIPGNIIKLKDKRFHRGANARETEGTGLGLSIVERYVDLHQGNIEYKSEKNNGTMVTVTLPISDSYAIDN